MINRLRTLSPNPQPTAEGLLMSFPVEFLLGTGGLLGVADSAVTLGGPSGCGSREDKTETSSAGLGQVPTGKLKSFLVLLGLPWVTRWCPSLGAGHGNGMCPSGQLVTEFGATAQVCMFPARSLLFSSLAAISRWPLWSERWNMTSSVET